MSEDRSSQIRNLIALGKEQGYLTYADINDCLPDDIVDPEQLEDIVNMINDMGITVFETTPDIPGGYGLGYACGTRARTRLRRTGRDCGGPATGRSVHPRSTGNTGVEGSA